MIDKFFSKLGGQKAVENFLSAKYPEILQGGPSHHDSMSRSTRSKNVTLEQPKIVTSQLTNKPRPIYAESGQVQPFDQVMSNFAMYGLANRGQLVA